jgi:periplasmic divalent cation tolerance protein
MWKTFVDKRLASCAQILGPMKSIYWWKGKMEETEEWLCILKTRKSLYPAVEEELRRLHPYELPEIIGMPIDHCLRGYAKWVVDETAREAQKKPTG